MGGENSTSTPTPPRWRGSSPRGRGKHHGADRRRSRRGLIPAWAGKTILRRRIRRRIRAHPRVGGENILTTGDYDGNLGSSPRGRGKRVPFHAEHVPPGLIPAWAGKTSRPASQPQGRTAHPRVGGENELLPRGGGSVPGSSPRGRGKLDTISRQLGGDRLIPAWAGKTSSVQAAAPPMRAHPRVGGENEPRACAPALIPGSSPRGRGKHHRPLARLTHRGLIPAWAGRTFRERS